jgi:hypothetical protein
MMALRFIFYFDEDGRYHRQRVECGDAIHPDKYRGQIGIVSEYYAESVPAGFIHLPCANEQAHFPPWDVLTSSR